MGLDIASRMQPWYPLKTLIYNLANLYTKYWVEKIAEPLGRRGRTHLFIPYCFEFFIFFVSCWFNNSVADVVNSHHVGNMLGVTDKVDINYCLAALQTIRKHRRQTVDIQVRGEWE